LCNLANEKWVYNVNAVLEKTVYIFWPWT
jgi:hypothetical protein